MLGPFPRCIDVKELVQVYTTSTLQFCLLKQSISVYVCDEGPSELCWILLGWIPLYLHDLNVSDWNTVTREQVAATVLAECGFLTLHLMTILFQIHFWPSPTLWVLQIKCPCCASFENIMKCLHFYLCGEMILWNGNILSRLTRTHLLPHSTTVIEGTRKQASTVPK